MTIDSGHTFQAGGQPIHNDNKAAPRLIPANKPDYGRPSAPTPTRSNTQHNHTVFNLSDHIFPLK